MLPFILITIDAAAYEENGGWYVYAKATNPTGTTYVSTPKMIIDVENPKAIDLSTGKELESYGKYYGDLRFKVEDSSPVTVRCHTSPSGKAALLTPDENGVYTIPAEYDNSIQHTLIIEDACGNVASYKSFRVFWNYLTNVREKDHWDVAPAQPIRISREQDLKEELSKVQIGVYAADTSGWIPVKVSWEIPKDYDPQSQREQTFTVNGTVILEGTGKHCNSGLDVITRPGEEWKKNISVQVTVEGDPQYKVTVQDCENGRVKVVNAAGTAEDGTPLFFKGELVMLSIDPDEGYMLSTLSVNGNPAAVAVGDDTYTFTQPEGDVTITAAFEMRNEHTVTFDANGGSEPEELPEEVTTAMPAKKILLGSEYSLPECEFIAPEGKQFKAWQIDGTEYPVNAPVTVTADITVKALWEDAPPAPAEYTVRFNANGGGGTMEDVTGVSGSYTLPACGFTEPEGKQFKGWSTSADGSVISSTTYEVSSDTTFYAIWESKEYSIIVTDGKATIGAGSEISKAAQGTKVTLTANAAPDGKEFDKWVVESGSTTLEDANSETTTFIMPDSEVSVKATYKNAPVTTYSLTTQVNGGHGTISASKTGLTAGSTETITFTPEVGYEIDTVTVNGTATSVSGNTLNVTMNENKTVIVTYKATGGGEHTHSYGSEWKNDADNHWHECSCGDKTDVAAHTASDWIIDTPATATADGTRHKECTVCKRVLETGTIPATGGGGGGYSYYTIKATAEAGGSISPSGNVSVREGRDQVFTFTPDKGYAISNVKIDGKSVGAVKSYTFENVRRTHTIEVIFMKANGNPQTGVFVDVATGSYYEDAVDWAVENGITKGTDDTHFSPDGICTRAQAVTFLWRAAGSPEPETRAMPFTDVPVGSYYYDAVLWAVENGITKGTSDTRFSPDDTCTRAQIVTFLWRSEKSPAAGSRNPFADVKSTAYYADAVLWAVKENITKGTTSTTFSPDADCTRSQIVTFLWRCKK